MALYKNSSKSVRTTWENAWWTFQNMRMLGFFFCCSWVLFLFFSFSFSLTGTCSRALLTPELKHFLLRASIPVLNYTCCCSNSHSPFAPAVTKTQIPDIWRTWSCFGLPCDHQETCRSLQTYAQWRRNWEMGTANSNWHKVTTSVI